MSTRAQVACFYIAAVALIGVAIGYGVHAWWVHAFSNIVIGGGR